DNRLGGDDFDNVIVDWMADDFKRQYNIDLKADRMALQRLKEAAEKAKKDLSAMVQTHISLPFISANANGPLHFEADLTRANFDKMTKFLVDKTIGPVRQALRDADLTPADIDQVLLVGGSTRMISVQEAVRQELGKEPNKSVNPDEVVAMGAAIQGAVLAGDVKDILLLDVTPLTLGIETLGGVMTKMIERNTTIPTSKSQIFSTAADNQPAVDIMVYQGERPMARDNKLLGNFQLTGIAPARRGIPQIEVKFDIDVNGIVHVSATDKATNRSQDITITNSSGLSDAEIDKMVRDAEENRAADEKRREEAELKNKAEAFISQIDDQLENSNQNVTEDQKKQVKDLRDELQRAVDTNDYDTLRTKLNELEKAAQAMSEAMYRQAQPNNDGSAQTNGNDDVYDADFKAK
ncbi:MAG: Hsp70 family protein, partial [Erysipelotrichaceae bacterium]|nr:Hsp70 family protein [Erysipelotrichaceae bacterium]